ncbi:Protein SCO1, mitochondrial [Neolecta irregularis DAH-3]|uniref:Protein SCO1, mitochondrial n=1 Tax=Neolecta irregularis (strain DAH-3) TaxID=1198029 RepID=A0A1U7LW41_NEOID|nr:Protein SCO1, mitochondrial [Neolecta irregularis DAH-3]|eukprot:OLL26895.1 Protein SCO1, mitochondrial [Neolecta irregularis DAH-3]
MHLAREVLKLRSVVPRPIVRVQNLRNFNTTSQIHAGSKFDTEQIRSRERRGPFTWKAGVLFLVTGSFLAWYFKSEKERMKRKRRGESNKAIGKPRVGGPFKLIDHNGKNVTDEDFLGRHMLVYFGFSHCPDICPDELDKMALMIDTINKKTQKMTPIFITCDPARDNPKQLKNYLKEFHEGIIGLTGDWENIRSVCKAYRVYFSTPPDAKPGDDYLVDHSIFFYLMGIS